MLFIKREAYTRICCMCNYFNIYKTHTHTHNRQRYTDLTRLHLKLGSSGLCTQHNASKQCGSLSVSCKKFLAFSLSLRCLTCSEFIFSFSKKSICFSKDFMCSWLPLQYVSKIRPNRTDTDATCISDLETKTSKY